MGEVCVAIRLDLEWKRVEEWNFGRISDATMNPLEEAFPALFSIVIVKDAWVAEVWK